VNSLEPRASKWQRGITCIQNSPLRAWSLRPALPEEERSLPNITARNAFGRVPFPEYWDVHDDKFRESYHRRRGAG